MMLENVSSSHLLMVAYLVINYLNLILPESLSLKKRKRRLRKM